MKNVSYYSEDIQLPNKLSKEEINKLFNDFYNGSLEAKEKLIMHNLRLITYRVNGEFRNLDYDKTELISIGQIGLIKAINTYDLNKGFDFSTYAIRCIDNEIKLFIRNQRKNVLFDSLDREVFNDTENIKVIDCLADNFNLENEYIEKEKRIIVRDIVESLSEREREIIKLYFGFYDRVYSQLEIAKKFNISHARVSKIIHDMLKKIKIRFNDLYCGSVNNNSKHSK